jgi:hypothetical protein
LQLPASVQALQSGGGLAAEDQQMTQSEDVIGEAGSVGVMLLDPQVGLVI